MTSATLTKALAHQASVSEQICSDAPRDLTLGKQDVVRQGDIYILPLSKLPPCLKNRASRQLADGDTQGSRHVLAGDAEMFDPQYTGDVAAFIGSEYPGVQLREYQIGPVFLAKGPVTVEHPEHGHRTLTEPGAYAVVFQRSLTADDREERARD